MNFYKHFIGDYARDTASLSALEHGVYRLMLDSYYATEKPLPADIGELYLIAKARTPAERKAVDKIAGRFFAVNGDGTRHNQRADIEIAEARAKSAKAKVSAAASVAARFGDREQPSARSASDPEWICLVEVCGSKCVRCGAKGPLQRDHIIPTYRGGPNTIENWQPLCMRCNASKGPETTDHRPLNWRSALAERTLNARQASQSQKPERSKASAATAAEGRGAAATVPDCPHEKLIELYHELLPTCTKVVEWNTQRQALMRARWREKAVAKGNWGYATEEEGLACWRKFFGYVAMSDFLTGNAQGRNGRAPFVATLEWLIRPTNFAKVVEGGYHR